jgi:hypothetical protein
MEQVGGRDTADILDLDSVAYLDDIRCVDLTEETLVRLQSNDRSIAGLKIQSDSWIAGTGLAIAKSERLKGLIIEIDSDGRWPIELGTWLTCNETIEAFKLDIGIEAIPGVVSFFAPFVLNDRNLRSIEIRNYFDDKDHMLSSLAFALTNCKSKKLKDVTIVWSRSARDEEVAELFRSFNGKRSLSTISYQNCRLERLGCKALADLLKNQSSTIKSLFLHGNDIDSDKFAILCDALTKNKSLRILFTSGTRLSVSSCFSLSTALSHPMSVVTHLVLDEAGIEDDGISFLCEILINNKTLRCLSLAGNESITMVGWRAFSRCLEKTYSSIVDLTLDSCNMDDEGVATIAAALAANTSLRYLSMNKNSRITFKGLITFFNLLLDNKSVLEILYMTGNNIAGNRTKGEDWGILSRALCDKTCISSTYESNHTFYELTIDESIREEIQTLLDMNNALDAEITAREKILTYHFASGNTGINALACLHETAMPNAIEWIGREQDGYSAMFDFVQRFPTLFDVSSSKQIRSRCRKRKYR